MAAQVMPSIRVTTDTAAGAGSRDAARSLERLDTGKSAKSEGLQQSTSNSGKLAAKLRSPISTTSSSYSATNLSNNNASPEQQQQLQPNGGAGGSSNYGDDELQTQNTMDPLSQQILQRTNTSLTAQKLRIQADNAAAAAAAAASGQSPTASPNDGSRPSDSKHPPDSARDRDGGSKDKNEKKKGVSFLSRFIGVNKRKGTDDGVGEDASEIGEPRQEGMDAQLFSHTVDNVGFRPKHQQPPTYIKVRSKFKKQKEFDRLFLAQELRAGADKKAPPEAGANPAPQSGAAAKSNPIWAVEFSKDGKYLAAGGQDRIVRVWAVIATAEERRAHENDESGGSTSDASTHLSTPVFQQKTFREYQGHAGAILDLSWSKNNFLLSSSMDKTVRLWHTSRNENLCTFKHADFVPSVQFHPRDDRFFLAGSLDTKLRLWSIPDKSVAFWTQCNDMVTSVAFTPDGKTCIAGTLGGICMFYDTEGLKFQAQMHVKSTRGQNAKGSKITGIQALHWPPGKEKGEVKLLISSNDSRLRLYNLRDKALEMKFRGHENNCSQIKARVADDTGHIICGSEDRKAYIWSTSLPEGEKKNQRPVEMFEAHNSITTCATMAPLKTRQLLSASEDPIFDLCNPPPVTLISKTTSVYSSKAPTEVDSAQPPLSAQTDTFKRAAESPAYLARSAHLDGNIIVTADYTGALKVFRQDCAYHKRLRSIENWDNASVFSKKANSLRPSSILSHRTGRSRRDSITTQPPNDRIMSWRQDISHGSFDAMSIGTPRRSHHRSVSPRKSHRMSISSQTRPHESPALGASKGDGSSESPKTSGSIDRTAHAPPPQVILNDNEHDNALQSPTTPLSATATHFDPVKPIDLNRQETLSNPLQIFNGQSWAFWNNNGMMRQRAAAGKLSPSDAADQRPELTARASVVSQLSSELSAENSENEEGHGRELHCEHCGNVEFKTKPIKGSGGNLVVGTFCARCGMIVEGSERKSGR
ncbi:WD40 repeat-like protein [Aaosphaeria arxii CBS 175.79]|uniref:WD40 repeat-like protein n=1 Tax=Aaosphaeria arxii CBS 175.79 TaxID=1450172 RepID=A0A6A5XFA0_9PLEO|nr:WD40 repeat-like protein [Aaosphaeria arxii CBS 175.79]KAF2011526.1 WD40 repeat-like protein [Aaosphaeria arxii CBS 175.79]